MDWRKRNYYLVYTDPYAYQMRHRYYQLAAPSLSAIYHTTILKSLYVALIMTDFIYIGIRRKCLVAELKILKRLNTS